MKMFLSGLVLFSAVSAHAEIPADFLKGNCQRQSIASIDKVGAIDVTDAYHCDALFTKQQLIEIAVEDLGYRKEIYLVDYDAGPSNSRYRTMHIVRNASEFNGALGTLDNLALYLGKNQGRDVFVLRLAAPFRPKLTRLEIYVKTGSQQQEIRKLTLH